MLDGSVLMPGQKLSVHDMTAPYDEDHGYVEAGSYEGGQVVDSYGGGICQVSTTLYNAALLAELKVVERHPHSMPVSYIELSRDAAIAGDYMDLVLQNPYDDPVYIEGMIDDENRLCFTVYGKETRPAGRRLEFQSETVEAEAYTVIYKENNKEPLGASYVSASRMRGRRRDYGRAYIKMARRSAERRSTAANMRRRIRS